MAEEKSLDNDLKLVAARVDFPMILDQADYVYVSYSQFMVTAADLRIAFGDRLPPDGKVKPSIGIIMSHHHAREFLAAMPKLQTALDNLDKAAGMAHAMLNSAPEAGTKAKMDVPYPEKAIKDD